MLKSLRLVWRLGAFLLNTLVCWACLELALLIRGKRSLLQVVNRWVPRWARVNLTIYGVEVLAGGAHIGKGNIYPGKGSNGTGRIFISNHLSAFDIPLLLSLVEAHAISRHDLADWPVIGRGARRIGTLFVNRRSRRSGADVLKEVARALENGEGVAMFPEGTTNPSDEVQAFHNGAFNAARRTGAELIPIGIAYDDPAAYYDSEPFLQHVKRITSLRRLRAAVEIGEPLVFAETDRAAMKEEARAVVQELVNRARRRLQGDDSALSTAEPATTVADSHG